jgi:hypothetical protein
MPRLRVKQWILIGGLVLFFALTVALVRGSVALVAYFQQAAEPVSPLNLVPDVPAGAQFDLTWAPDAADTGRAMEPFTRRQIESAYLRAWLQLNLSLVRQEPYGLRTYFVGPARAAVTENVTTLAAAGWLVEQSNSGHRLALHFYSADGSIVAFTDHNAVITRQISDADGNVIYAGAAPEVYDVVMFLEDGNWRVRHWLRVDVDVFSADSSP